MQTQSTRQWTFFLALVAAVLVFAFLAAQVEGSFGRVDVSQVTIQDPSGVELVAKLYRPQSASSFTPKPAVLTLHGFQNDKETESAFAIELARRGFVVLSLDQFGHGHSGTPAAGWEDDTLGGNAAYAYLKALPYVQAGNLGVMGHSMGAGTTLAVGTANPDHRALNPQCGNPGTPDLNNVLLTQARFEEFAGFRENEPRVEGLTTHPDRLAGFGLSGEAEWDVTYGSCADGSARRQTLVNTVHPGVTHHGKAVTQALLWMQAALKDGQADGDWIPAEQHIYPWKEAFTFLALLGALVALLPLTNLLVSTAFFAEVAQPMPDRYVAAPRQWWRMAWVNTLIAGLSFPILAAAGGFILSSLVPQLKMLIANGVMVWFLGNMLIYLVILFFWYRRAKKEQGVNLYDLGLSFDSQRSSFPLRILAKTLGLAGILMAFLYLLVALSERLFLTEFRLIWPFMRTFTPERFGLFWVYLIPAVLFFLLNGGVFLFGQARQPQSSSPAKTQLVWWLKNCFAGLFGLFLIWAFQYLPFLFFGQPAGFEWIGLDLLSGMIPLLLFVYIPEFILLFFFLTWFYRRTGKVYLGALVIAAIATWFMVAGTAITGG
ncbi:MAG: alpha/beta hydrolase [Anaerolineales bacterium]|nr:alpha/beta hydrolase [Anaerolineales bacterium]